MLKSTTNIFNKVSVLDDDTTFDVTKTNLSVQLPAQLPPHTPSIISDTHNSLAPDPPQTHNQISNSCSPSNTTTQPPVQSLNLRRSSRTQNIPIT